MAQRRAGRAGRVPGWLAATAAVFGVGLAWTGAWYWAAGQADRALDGWIAAEKGRGRAWTCPGRLVEGFPLALRVRCAKPTFQGEVVGHEARGTVEGLAAEAGLFHPGTIEVALAGPLALGATDGSFELVASWASLALTLDGLGRPPDGGTLRAESLAVTLLAADLGDGNLRVARLTGRAKPATAEPDGQDFGFAAESVTFPVADPLVDLPGPVQLSGSGTLSRFDLLRAPTARSLDAWREAGGRLGLAELRVGKGPFTGSASGSLGLDGEHRLAGRLDATFAGFEPVARRYGIPVAGIQIGGLVAGLLGGGKGPSRDPPGSLRLPLLLADGRLAVGPFTTGLRLVPLY